MFSKLSTLALAFPAAALALQLAAPKNPTSGGPTVITWTNEPTDPAAFSVFSLELTNPDLFHNAIAIANNVVPATGTVAVTLPIVQPGGGYTLQAVNIGNISDVFAVSPDFVIGATSSTSESATPSAASSGSAASGSHTTTTTPIAPPPGTTSFGVTVTPSPSPSTGASGGASGSGSGSPSAAPSAFNAAAPRFALGGSAPALAVMLVAAAAGALVAL